MNVMVLTDNEFLYFNFKELVKQEIYNDTNFNFFFSDKNETFKIKYLNTDFKSIDLKKNINEIIKQYQLVISLHCKQIFPEKLVNKVRCINIHPGFNPYNRGWFPQIFSIINDLPAGVTIHEMDKQLDHGPIIVQRKVEIMPWETSYDIYKKVQEVEIELLGLYLRNILDSNYTTQLPAFEGNINWKKDFDDLCEINLEKSVTFGQAINFFRAMSFTGYKNTFFYDSEGRKIFIRLELELEK